MKAINLICDANGQLSHTRLWSSIAYASATVSFLWLTFTAETPHPEIWLIYLGVVGAHAATSKYLTMRYGANDAKQG